MSTIKHLINVLFLSALCLSLGLVCGHVTPSLRFQLVGFTSTLHLGDTGVLGFTLACQAEFPGSRMCTSAEVVETTNVPATLSGEAWVRPSIKAANGGLVFDESGVAEAWITGCQGWSSTSSTNGFLGLTVDDAGRFRDADCAPPRPVSCCAWMP